MYRRGLWVLVMVMTLMGWAVPGSAQGETPVSTINETVITRAEFHARLRFVRWQYLKELQTYYEITDGNLGILPDYVNTLLYYFENPDMLGDAVLGQLEEDALLWQTSAELNLSPTAEDAQERENEFFSLWTNVAPEELAGDSEAQTFISTWYAEAMAASGMTREQIQQVFVTDALRSVLQTYVAERMPTEEEAVHTRQILCGFHPDDYFNRNVPTADERTTAEACIAEAQTRLAAGEDFAVVAADLSSDEYRDINGSPMGSATLGGDQGWTLISYLDEPIGMAVTGAALNTVLGPIETEAGLHLVEVLEQRMQALTEEELEEAKVGYFNLWIDTLLEEAMIERSADWNVDLPLDPALDTLAPEILTAIADLEASAQSTPTP